MKNPSQLILLLVLTVYGQCYGQTGEVESVTLTEKNGYRFNALVAPSELTKIHLVLEDPSVHGGNKAIKSILASCPCIRPFEINEAGHSVEVELRPSANPGSYQVSLFVDYGDSKREIKCDIICDHPCGFKSGEHMSLSARMKVDSLFGDGEDIPNAAVPVVSIQYSKFGFAISECNVGGAISQDYEGALRQFGRSLKSMGISAGNFFGELPIPVKVLVSCDKGHATGELQLRAIGHSLGKNSSQGFILIDKSEFKLQGLTLNLPHENAVEVIAIAGLGMPKWQIKELGNGEILARIEEEKEDHGSDIHPILIRSGDAYYGYIIKTIPSPEKQDVH